MEELPRTSIRCRACGYDAIVTLSQMTSALLVVRVLKARSDASPELVRELYIAHSAKLACPDCDAVGIAARPAPAEDDEAWGQRRACEGCKAVIPAERLALLPHARLCAACQARDERGEGSEEREFCPRCGGLMQLAPRTGRGITRYAMRCPSCRR